MKITDAILNKYYGVRSSRRSDPKNIYLGKQEWRALRDWAEENLELRADSEGIERLNFSGMEVFQVDAENHLNVS